VKGAARIMYKPKGYKNLTSEYTPKTALAALKSGLAKPNRAYIYHCYNHYMCPVGFEETPLQKTQVFKKEVSESESWLIVADQSKNHPTFHCIKWEDVLKDLNCENPEYLDVRHLYKGI